MNWFDQLFGEDDKDQSSQRSKRRKKKRHDHTMDDTGFVQQSPDVYQRPRGKFRFPIDMHDEVTTEDHQVNASHMGRTHNKMQDIRATHVVERQQRRHRGVQQAHYHANQSGERSESQSYISHEGTSTSKRHTQGKRQWETASQPNYHQKPFKASEVPSAIFGTQPPKQLDSNRFNSTQGARKTTAHSVSNESDVRSSESQMDAVPKDEKRVSGKSKNPTRRRNTINLENFYASQIVEEIRREREKKLMKKKNFKEALKKKRESQAYQQQPDIQKAIDDMYSAQARQLLGETYAKDTNDTIEDEPTTHDSETPVVSQSDTQETEPNFEYEEIDLTQVEMANDDDAQNRTAQSTDEEVTQPVVLHTDHPADTDDVEYTEHDYNSEMREDQVESLNDNDTAVDMAPSVESERLQDDEEVNQAQRVEITNDMRANQEGKDEEANDSEVVVDARDTSEPTTRQTSENVPQLEPELKPVLDKKSTDKQSTLSTQQSTHTKRNEGSNIQQTPQQRQQIPIRKGSKPFNVVMTPSDKKRMMARQQQRNSANQMKEREAPKHFDTVQNLAEHTAQQGQPITGVATKSEPLSTNKETTMIRRGPNIKLPSIDLLDAPEQREQDEAWIASKKDELNKAFYYFNVPAEVVNVVEGPSVTRFELSVERGVKVSRITALQDDIKMALAAKDIRIEAPIPGTSLVGIEVPNPTTTKVNIRSIIDSVAFKQAESKLTVAMGNRINNEPLLMDIAKTPHALIAGATGSGKSVSINSILLSLLYRNHPEELRLLLIDPKMVELAPYNGLPHLVAPVITDVKAATQSLKWAVDEMERRFKLFAHHHVRNISAFNNKVSYDQRIPKIVIVIDELADLMMMAPQDVEQSIARLAQKARACGIHMLVATQRPSVNVITGLIKANIPTRIAFMVSSSVDSRTILDSGGAERLLGYGDMLYLGSGMNKPIRVQGTFVSDEEIDQVVDFIRSQREPEYLFQEKELLEKTETPAKDELFDDVCAFMVREQSISTSLIQRHFQIGYNRAARIIDQLEQLGFISGANGSKPRDVFLSESDLDEL
ncbi:DNA translocase FtsK [Staphylococcus lutrae]|uniref:Cell division protein FtsK n=1 Tax=Staphylococcus lutrae TaxID=155085 RepID=A0AAC9WIJ2_9STAP|nr:DNA translocase FtsK [Staphylococcus lutrae]ARJ50028.1 cell division protein FtsK [Staphylococcus lutrae]PNZ38969.1 DNA translocase FtsK [Staphylococcus lutrae]